MGKNILEVFSEQNEILQDLKKLLLQYLKRMNEIVENNAQILKKMQENLEEKEEIEEIEEPREDSYIKECPHCEHTLSYGQSEDIAIEAGNIKFMPSRYRWCRNCDWQQEYKGRKGDEVDEDGFED